MSTLLIGKVALVTGAGSGIGKEIAVGLAEQGAEVILIGRREQVLNETRDLIRSKGGKASSHIADVCQKVDVDIMAQKVLAQTGVPSILVNAAGIYGEISPISLGDPELWIQTLMTNTAGPYLICRAFVSEMMQKGWGRIVNVTSAASLAPPRPANSAYAVSKVALNHFTRQLAVELEGSGVTANVMHPGEVKTEMFEAIKKADSTTGNMSKWLNWVEQTGGDAPEKSVKLILDLVKPESDHINGRFLWIENGLKKAVPSWD